MLDTGYRGADLIAFAIVWDGFSRDWKHSAITKFAACWGIVIPDYIWGTVIRLREEGGEK